MTLQGLEDALKSVCADTYELGAPPGLSRYIVWQVYGHTQIHGSDKAAVELPRVQIDILWQPRQRDDILADQVRDKLNELCIPHTEDSYGYDPEYERMRCILELVLV